MHSLGQTSRKLSDGVSKLHFSVPTAYIYNPLEYAWAIHQQYLKLAGAGKKKVVILGMNLGPFGMAQTGVPLGKIRTARD